MGFTVAAQDRCARRARAPDGHTHYGLRGFAFKSGFKIFLVSQIRLKAESASHIPFFYCYKTPRSSLQPCPCPQHERRSRVLGRSTSVSWRGLPDCKRRCISHQVQFCNAVSCLHRFAKLEASNTPLSVAAAAAVVGQSLQQRDRRSEPRSSSAPKSRLQLRPRLAPPSNSRSAAPSVRSAR